MRAPPTVVGPRTAPTLDVLSRSGLLWYQGRRIALNPLDTSLCADVYSAYCARQSKLYIYPTTSYVLPAVFVAALLVNTFARSQRTDYVPKILFYAGIEGRDLFRDLRIGVQRERITETFGFVQLNRLVTSAFRDADTRSINLIVDGDSVVLHDVIDAIALKRVTVVKGL
jgi:hypothetical protein